MMIKAMRIGGLFDTNTRHQAGAIWDINSYSPTVDTCQGGYREPLIVEDENDLLSVDLSENRIRQENS